MHVLKFSKNVMCYVLQMAYVKSCVVKSNYVS